MLFSLLWAATQAGTVTSQDSTSTPCPIDCQAGLDNWELGWADWKKAYCCEHEQIACPATTTATTTSCSYDCNVGLNNWQAGWADSKKAWCCQHEGLGCPETTTTTSCSYDCQIGLQNWEANWADMKKEYCCAHEGLGCATTATATKAPLNCAAAPGPDVVEGAWPEYKKEYCCSHEGIGCATTATATTPLDCAAAVGLNGVDGAWPEYKKDWCCKNKGVACPTTTTSAPFACMVPAGLDLSLAPPAWSSEERVWCCKLQNRGCATATLTVTATTSTTVYDCNAGAAESEASWPMPKASWCCQFKGRGCPSTNTSTTTATISVTSVTLTLPHDIMHCRLSCLGAPHVHLPGSVGEKSGASLNDVSLDGCRRACVATKGCEGVVFTNETKGTPFKTMCFGRRAIHTSMCQPGGRYFTEVLGASPWGKCAIFGDPHVISFDRVYGPPVTMLSPGEYHLVKSKQLTVQGRFGYTRRFPTAASTVGLAVGGPRLGSHVLAVVFVGPAEGAKGFKVLWDKKEILKEFPSKFTSEDGVMTATHEAMDPSTYHREGRHTIGGTTGLLPSYLFDFGEDLTVYVLIGPDNCNAVIMTKKVAGGQDGYCGNFNCDQEDDSLEELRKRGMAQPLPAEESLFKDYGAEAPAWVMKKVAAPSLEDCDPAVKAKATQECRSLPNGEAESCIFDACAAHSATAAHMDATLLAPPPPLAAAAAGAAGDGCVRHCTFGGRSASCRTRIHWGATHRFQHKQRACQLALVSVLEQCPACSSCSLAASGCTDREHELRFLENFEQGQQGPPKPAQSMEITVAVGLASACLCATVVFLVSRTGSWLRWAKSSARSQRRMADEAIPAVDDHRPLIE